MDNNPEKGVAQGKGVDQEKGVDKKKGVDRKKGVDQEKGIDQEKSVDQEKGVDKKKGVDQEKSVNQEKNVDQEKGVNKKKVVDQEKSVDQEKCADHDEDDEISMKYDMDDDDDDAEEYDEDEKFEDDDYDMTVPNPNLKFVTREKWEGLPPTWTEPLKLPAERLYFMFTETNRCTKKAECANVVKTLQKEYMDKGMPDIPFSFIIGGDLRVYEGRGWRTKISRSDVEDWNDGRIVIAYICRQQDHDDNIDNMMEKGYEVMYYGIDHQYLMDFDKDMHQNEDMLEDIEALKREVERRQKKEDPKEFAMKHETF